MLILVVYIHTEMFKLLRLTAKFAVTFIPVTVSIFALPALAERWIRVTTDNDDNIYYIDKDSITGSGRYRRYWDAIVYREPKRGVYRRIFFNSVDCKTRQLRVRIKRDYDENNKLIRERDDGGDGELFVIEVDDSQLPVFKLACSK